MSTNIKEKGGTIPKVDIERRETYIGGRLSRTLDQVIKRDYFCTQKALREIFIPSYNSKEFESIVPALRWIKASDDNLDLFLKSGFTNDKPETLPDYVRRNQATISLWFELAKDNNDHKGDIPVAFSVRTPAFYEDLKYLVLPGWGKISSRAHDQGETKDLIGEQLFRIYWHRLVERYKFISAGAI